jgi:hypothetical protein
MRSIRKVFGAVPRLVVAAAVVALVSGSVGVALASIPSSNGRIHACYATKGGDLRVIDTAKGQKCQAGEKALGWSQRGPRGLTGAAGATGPTGAAGTTGAKGQVILTYVTETFPLTNGVMGGGRVECPTGQSVTGGSVWASGLHNQGIDVEVINPGPFDSPADSDSVPNNGWATFAITQVPPPSSYSVSVTAICTEATSVD